LGNVVGPSEAIFNLSVGINNRWQHSLAVMEAITAFEQDPIRIGHALLAIVGESFVSIRDPHCCFTVDTAK
jgi:hypothetical protein